MYRKEEYRVHACSQIPAIVTFCQKAMTMQDASNVMGLSLGLHEQLVEVSKATNHGTEWLACLPPTRLWVHHISNLTRTSIGLDPTEWRACMDWCDMVTVASGLGLTAPATEVKVA